MRSDIRDVENPMIPKIDVCIASYKRPQLLKKLLQSLFVQETEGEFMFSIIVTDNDVQRSAEPVVNVLNAWGRNMIYAVEPEQNISLARNKSLSLARGEYIATIDDDEYADTHWLLYLYRALVAHNADVVIGQVKPAFHDRVPRFVRDSRAFRLPNPATGSTENFALYTGNSLFRRSLVQEIAIPFDPDFGRTGGGDSAFFEAIRKQGRKCIWCREALVFEYIPPARTRWRWILKREYRRGNVYFRAYDSGIVDPDNSSAANILDLGRRVLRIFCPVPYFLAAGLLDVRYKTRALERLRSCAFHVGMIAYFLGFRYEEYRKT